MRRYIVYILFFIMLLSSSTLTNVHAEEDDVEMRVSYGFEGYYKIGRNTPVNVEIVNNGEDFEGVIEIEVPRTDQELIRYAKSVNLPRNTTKNVQLIIPFVGNYNTIEICLTHDNETIKSMKRSMTMGRMASDRLLVGVLSDDFNSLSYIFNSEMKQVLVNSLTLVKLDSEVLPTNPIGFDNLDVIIINDYDSSQLSEDQYQGLKEWVNNGGHLILGSGPTYSKTLALFDDNFLTGELGETETVTTDFGITNVPEIVLETQEIVLSESNSLFDQDLVQVVSKGKGMVALASFDLGLEPMASWEGNKSFAVSLMDQLITQSYMDDLYMKENGTDFWRLNDILSVTPNTTLPNMRTLLIIMGIYIFLVGPIIYFILKRLDKRQWLWIAVPVLSFTFAFIIYTFGSPTRFNEPFINKANVVTINEDTVSMNTYAGIISPNSNDLELQIPAEYATVVLNNYGRYNYYGDPSQEIEKKLKAIVTMDSDYTTIELKELAAFSTNVLQIQSTPNWEGTLEAEILLSGEGFQGTITNSLGYALEDAFIVGKGMYAKLDVIEEGENEIAHTYQLLNNIYAITEDLFPNRYNRRQEDEISIQERIKERQRSGLFELNFEMYRSMLPTDAIYLVGYSQDIEESHMFSETWDQYNSTIVIMPIEVNLMKEGKVEYPLGYIQPNYVGGDYNSGYDANYQYMYGETVELAYTIDPELIVENIVFKNSTNNMYGKLFNGELYLYNIETEEYERFGYNSEILNEENLDTYLDEENTIRIKLVNTTKEIINTREPMSIPLIQVKGRVE